MKTITSPQSTGVQIITTGSVMKNDRRASKPLMEKRRRERINKSLNELKSILLHALRKDQSTCHSKLEKADILEMTVRYLRGIQRHRMNAALTLDPSVASKYRTGFVECKNEVAHFLESSSENVHPDVKTRLMNHLGNNHFPLPILTHHILANHRSAPLLTTTAPVMAGSTLTPLQIQMTPNTQIHQAMAAAAVAMAQNHTGLSAPMNCYAREHSESPQLSPETVYQNRRRNSSSSIASSGFASPGSPLSPTNSPSKSNVQGHFVLIPNSPKAQVSTTVEEINSQCRSPIPPPLSPSHESEITSIQSPYARPISPSDSEISDSDSVWRPW
uniref:BHLH domain-containing protein n=1 Tax=Ciona savignyi TaxID=51511 RepID=H2YNP7_CIOSA